MGLRSWLLRTGHDAWIQNAGIARRYNARMSDRLTNVEEKIAYLEQFVSELDGVVRELHDGLNAVRREVGQLRNQLGQQGQGDDEGDDLEAQRPPHY